MSICGVTEIVFFFVPIFKKINKKKNITLCILDCIDVGKFAPSRNNNLLDIFNIVKIST